jgi:hypothetical protein
VDDDEPVHNPVHSRGFRRQAVENGDGGIESPRFGDAPRVKLLAFAGRLTKPRYPRAYSFNILFESYLIE